MEFEILDALDDLRYTVKVDEVGLRSLLKDTKEFSKLLEWICKELKSCGTLEESVTVVENPEDVSSFHMELSSLLKELGCNHDKITTGTFSDRFDSENNRLLLLNYLLGELQAARIIYVNNPKQLKVELSESSTAQLLREMLQTLGIPKPPAGVTTKALLGKVNERLQEILKKMPPKLIDKPFFNGHLSEKQWAMLEDLNAQFKKEYVLRREMLLKRLDVTIQSFHWSDRLKHKKDEINKRFREKRDLLSSNPSVKLSDILAARSDLAIIEKTSSSRVRMNTKSAVNKVVIGKVPDRGGRPNEAQPPPPEMPPWQQRQGAPGGGQGWSQGPQQQRDYGEGRGPRGGGQRPKVQGGWSDHGSNVQQNYQQQNYQQQQPNYQQQQQPAYNNYRQNNQNTQNSYGGGNQGNQSYNQGGGGGYHQENRSGSYGDKAGYDRDQAGNYQGQGGYGRNQGDHHQQGGGGGGYRGGGQRGRGACLIKSTFTTATAKATWTEHKNIKHVYSQPIMEKKVSKSGNKISKKLSKIISGRKSSANKSDNKTEKDDPCSVELIFRPSTHSTLNSCEITSRIASTCNQYLRNKDYEFKDALQGRECAGICADSSESAKTLLVMKKGKLELASKYDNHSNKE
ncbi:unnamed protein product [Allacma fusca]|uniref:Protein FAM98A n=1 Tax=Allacma fusca TaxID=39272 RepID=A0A8J2LFU2_9HEXA|nr:unnamed protein product [Allacma fusca]